MTLRRLLALLAVLSGLQLAPARAATPVGDPAGWSDRRLAAQLVLAGFTMNGTDDATPWLQAGLGGVLLFGTAPPDLAARLSRLRAVGQVVPFVASDEEGGLVQRLRPLLPALPSAEVLGRTRTPPQVRALALSYGRRMRAIGVDMDLAPVADLAVPGRYIARTHRAFSASPGAVAAFTVAWQQGMAAAGVAAVAKHWPGHGSAPDSHDRAAIAPPLATLATRDLVPFRELERAGIPAVMVGHLLVPGLTEPGLPASLSPGAYRYLRAQAGPGRLLLTDSLDMGAIRRGAGLTAGAAALRALRAGADMVLLDPGGPGPVIDAVASALAGGRLPRAQAAASARRVLTVKRTLSAPLPPAALLPGPGAVTAAPVLSAVVRDRVPGVDTATFFVRRGGSTRWDIVNAAAVDVPAGGRAAYRVPISRLRPSTSYVWQMRACNTAGRCSASSSPRTFRTPPSAGPSATPTATLVP